MNENPSAPDVGTGDAITAAENTLRDVILSVMGSRDADWLDASGLTPDRLQRMADRLSEERRRRSGTVIEERLLYYSDLPDLKTIVDKHWDRFKPCFDNKRTFDVYMDRLVDMRTAQMHGRELLPFEQQLAHGISGEFRNRVTIFRSGQGPDREYFPRIEYVRDSFGNTVEGYGGGVTSAETQLILRPGDVVTFDLRAWDPEAAPYTWRVIITAVNSADFSGESYEWRVTEADIGERVGPTFYLASSRPYHRRPNYDDAVTLYYRVLPAT